MDDNICENIKWKIGLNDEIVAPYMIKTMAEMIKRFDENLELIPNPQDKEYNHDDFMKFIYSCKVALLKEELGEENYESINSYFEKQLREGLKN